MSNLNSATFRLEDYSIVSFAFNKPEEKEELTLNVDFSPSGIYSESDNTFVLTFDFTAFIITSNNNNFDVVKATLESKFVFGEETTFEDIPDFFYKNSIAIVFPYLRAFVSNLTLQANTTPIILPTLNLSNLEPVLRENTHKA